MRRSRRLVVSMMCTVGNDEYGCFWYFFDGNPALDLPPSPPKACHHH